MDKGGLCEQARRHTEPVGLRISVDLFAWVERHLLSLEGTYLPGKDNLQADSHSRIFRNPHEWMLNLVYLKQIFLDDFGDRSHGLGIQHSSPRYISWFWDPAAFVQDAMGVSGGVRVSAIAPEPEGSHEASRLCFPGNSNHSLLAQVAMVLSVVADVDCGSNSIAGGL